jgi:hypothetical protein
VEVNNYDVICHESIAKCKQTPYKILNHYTSTDAKKARDGSAINTFSKL